MEQMDFVEPPKKKKKSKSKTPSVKKMASLDQIAAVTDDMKMPEMGPPADYINGSCSTMASPIQDESKPKK